MTVTEAIKIIERQACDFAAEKAREYRDEAVRQLEAHAPVPVDAWLRAALDLFGLDEEERNRLLNFQATRVKPALTARDRQQRLREAEIQVARRRPGRFSWPVVPADPYTPGLEDVRQEMIARVILTWMDD